MITMMKNKGDGVELCSLLSLALISTVCFAFVDDADLVVDSNHCYSMEEILKELFQQSIVRWAESIGVTGGELYP